MIRGGRVFGAMLAVAGAGGRCFLVKFALRRSRPKPTIEFLLMLFRMSCFTPVANHERATTPTHGHIPTPAAAPFLPLQARAADPSPQLRCTGSSHSWTNLFADDGGWLVDTSGLKDITWSSTETPTQVDSYPAVVVLYGANDVSEVERCIPCRVASQWYGRVV